MRGKYYYLIFLCIIIDILVVYAVNSQNITVVYSNEPYFTKSVSTLYHNSICYVSLNDFASLFNARTYFNEENKKVILYLDNKILKITAFNPFIIVDQQTYQIPAEAICQNKEIYVPLHYFIEVINKIAPNRIIYNNLNNQLEIITPSYSNINNIDVEEKLNGTLITIHTSTDFSESNLSLRSGHGWLYLDLYGGKVDSSSLYGEYNKGLVTTIVPSQVSEDLAQLGFRLRDEVIEKQLILQNPKEILVSVKTKKDLSKEITKNLEREKRKWRIDKIVIDPGHGGRDPGAIGKYGTKEKDVVLSIAHYLKEMIEEDLNIQVLMTREDDRFLELDQRTEFANRNQAKLFISIHANSNRNYRIRGTSTYFLGPENTEEAREVANLENSVIRLENGSKYADLSQENFILSAMAQNVYNKESQDLADTVQREIVQECGLRDLGVRQAGFYVLWGASMPNILIETAFISNPNEEKLLRSKSFQKQQASAILRSIKKFKEKYELEL